MCSLLLLKSFCYYEPSDYCVKWNIWVTIGWILKLAYLFHLFSQICSFHTSPEHLNLRLSSLKPHLRHDLLPHNECHKALSSTLGLVLTALLPVSLSHNIVGWYSNIICLSCISFEVVSVYTGTSVWENFFHVQWFFWKIAWNMQLSLA